MPKKHKKTDLEILEEDVLEANKEEKKLKRLREQKLKQYYVNKKKLSKLNTKNGELEKLPAKTKGGIVVKRDSKGRLLPGQSLSPAHKFIPGVSANPSGRPKKTVFDDAIMELLAKVINDPTKKKKHGRPRKNTAASILARVLFKQAIAGKKGAMQLLAERAGGKPKQEIDAKVENTTPISPEQRAARIQELLEKRNS